jgi:hypothetical protein
MSETYPANKLRRCADFDWIEGLNILPLEVGDRILGRWRHSDAGRKWFPGIVVRIQTDQNGELVHDIDYDDGDQEEGMLRANIKGRETRNGPDGRPGPCLKYKAGGGKEIDPAIGKEKKSGKEKKKLSVRAAVCVHARANSVGKVHEWITLQCACTHSCLNRCVNQASARVCRTVVGQRESSMGR